ncbi:MAG: oligosaccharide flippase family protein [Promethearchaeota archaeon]
MDSTKIFLLIIGNIVNIILSLIFFYLIRILFNYAIVGYYGTFISFFTALEFINHLGFSIAYLKYFSEANNNEEEALCNGTFLTYRIIQFTIYSIAISSLIPFISIYPGNLLVVYAFFFGWVFVRISIFDFILLSKKEAFKRSIGAITLNFLKSFLLIVLINYFKNDIWLLIWVLLISNISYFSLNTFFIKSRGFKKPNREYLTKFLHYSAPFFISSIFIFVVNNIDVLLIEYWSNILYVANYFTAKQLYSYFLIIISSISNILLTTFSKNIKEGRVKENFPIINYTHKILNLIVLPIILVILLYATNVLTLIFGVDYLLTGQILSIFILLLIPLSIDCANTIQLQALGKVKFTAKFIIIENVIAIILMIFFIAPFLFNLGVFGGALAFLLAKIITQLIYRPIIYKKYNLGFYWGSFRNLFIMAGIYFVQLWINIVFTFPFYFMILFALLDVSLYFILNYLLKGFTKEDFKFILHLVNLNRIYESITTEFKDKEEE